MDRQQSRNNTMGFFGVELTLSKWNAPAGTRFVHSVGLICCRCKAKCPWPVLPYHPERGNLSPPPLSPSPMFCSAARLPQPPWRW